MNEIEAQSESEPVELGIAGSLRSIARAVHRHSRLLAGRHGLTGPQIATLRTLRKLSGASSGDVARSVGLSHPTVTGILDRLEAKGLVARARRRNDRRSILVSLTEAGRAALRDVPSVLPTDFWRAFGQLPTWERTTILATLQRVAAMMGAGTHGTRVNYEHNPENTGPTPQQDAPARDWA